MKHRTRHYTVAVVPPFTCANGAVVDDYRISGDLSPEAARDAVARSYGPESHGGTVLETRGMLDETVVEVYPYGTHRADGPADLPSLVPAFADQAHRHCKGCA